MSELSRTDFKAENYDLKREDLLPSEGLGIFKDTFDIHAEPPTKTQLMQIIPKCREDEIEVFVAASNRNFGSETYSPEGDKENGVLVASVSFRAERISLTGVTLVIEPRFEGTYEIVDAPVATDQ